MVSRDLIHIDYVAANEMAADNFTKSLPNRLFLRSIDPIGPASVKAHDRVA